MIITDSDRYIQQMNFEMIKLEEEEKLPFESKRGFIHGYQIAASYWHKRGFTEGWNDHIEQLFEIMEKVGRKSAC